MRKGAPTERAQRQARPFVLAREIPTVCTRARRFFHDARRRARPREQAVALRESDPQTVRKHLDRWMRGKEDYLRS